jgi:Na+/H+-dicarboxylate symporter
MPRSHATVILFLIAGGVVCAGALGWLWPSGAAQVGFVGDLFLNSLRMLIIPLVVAAVVSGVAALGDVRKFGRLGAMAVG